MAGKVPAGIFLLNAQIWSIGGYFSSFENHDTNSKKTSLILNV